MKNDLAPKSAPTREERIVSGAFLSGLLDPMSRLARKLCAGTGEDGWKPSVLSAKVEALSLYRQDYFAFRPSNFNGSFDPAAGMRLSDALADFEPYLSLPAAVNEEEVEKFRCVVRQMVGELLDEGA